MMWLASISFNGVSSFLTDHKRDDSSFFFSFPLVSAFCVIQIWTHPLCGWISMSPFLLLEKRIFQRKAWGVLVFMHKLMRHQLQHQHPPHQTKWSVVVSFIQFLLNMHVLSFDPPFLLWYVGISSHGSGWFDYPPSDWLTDSKHCHNFIRIWIWDKVLSLILSDASCTWCHTKFWT